MPNLDPSLWVYLYRDRERRKNLVCSLRNQVLMLFSAPLSLNHSVLFFFFLFFFLSFFLLKKKSFLFQQYNTKIHSACILAVWICSKVLSWSAQSAHTSDLLNILSILWHKNSYKGGVKPFICLHNCSNFPPEFTHAYSLLLRGDATPW